MPENAEELLRVTLSSIGDGVIATDRHGKVTFLNPVAQMLTGWTQAQAVGRGIHNIFQVSLQDTEGRFIYDLGKREWDIPKLRELLEDILPQNHSFDGFEVEHDFEGIGPKFMVLNARRVQEGEELILLAIEDATER